MNSSSTTSTACDTPGSLPARNSTRRMGRVGF
jgi:hypothetical protein